MAILKKTLFDERLETINVLVNDTDPSSRYFKITELPDTFTGGKNAFLIQGSTELVPDTIIKIQIKDANGNTIYYEPGEGSVSSSLNGESFVGEYYEGTSKVVAVYIYPDTAYGPATITILGELSEYETNGVRIPVPENWKDTYNVKWERQINVNPTLANTTKIRFYKRPTVSIVENLEPIYRIEGGVKVNSGISQSFANVNVSNIDTFAGDVKRVKVYRTSQGNISDFDLIQDILVESKELLTSYELSGSVVGNAGFMTSEVLNKLWSYPQLTATLDSTRIDNGVKLSPLGLNMGNFTFTSSLNLSQTSVYEFGIDAFFSGSDPMDMNVYVSGSNNGEVLVGTLNGVTPTKNLEDTIFQFQLPLPEPTASLYLGFDGYLTSSFQQWHIGNLSLKLSQDTAFSPDSISFITAMPTVIGNETYNFKFEFYDINNNYVPVAVTASATFTGGNDNIAGAIAFISASSSASFDALYDVSASISGTITFNSSSISGTVGTLSGSVSGTIGTLSSSVSGSIGTVSGSVYTLSGSVSGTIGTLSGSVSSSITSLSSSLSSSISTSFSSSTYYALSQSNYTFNRATSELQKLADGNYSGSFIGQTTIYSPSIGGQNGYISQVFRVGQNGITLDGTNKAIYVGSGVYNNSNTPFYFASGSTDVFSLGDKLSFNGSDLNVSGTISGSSVVGSTLFGSAIEGGNISIGSGFTVNQFGELFATNATISGSVTAGEGNIGGFDVEQNRLVGSASLLVFDASIPEIQIYTGSSQTPKVVLNSNANLTSTGTTTVYISGSSYLGTSGSRTVTTPYDGVAYRQTTNTFSQSFGTTVSSSLVPITLESGIQPYFVTLPEVQFGVNNLQQTYTPITTSAPSPPYPPSFVGQVYNPYFLTTQNSTLSWYLQLYDSSGTTFISETEIPNTAIRATGAGRTEYWQSIDDPDPEITYSWQYVSSSFGETYTGNLGTAGTRPVRSGFLSIPSTAQYKVRMVVKVTANPGTVSGFFDGIVLYETHQNTARFVQADSADINYLNFRFSPNINKTEINGGGIQVLTNANVYVRTYRLNSAASNQNIFEVKGGYAQFEGYSPYTSSAIIANGEVSAKSTVRIGSEFGSPFGPPLHSPGPLIVTSKWEHPSASAYFETNIEPGDGILSVIGPPTTTVNDGVWNLGSSIWRWKDIWATNGTIQTSDRNYKTEISASNLGLDFINKLNPVSYKKTNAKTSRVEITLEDGTTKEKNVANVVGNRRHYGLIAQEVKEAIEDSGLTTMDFGGYIAGNLQEDTNLALRYDEFIAPMIKAIQELSNKVNQLEEIISGSL